MLLPNNHVDDLGCFSLPLASSRPEGTNQLSKLERCISTRSELSDGHPSYYPEKDLEGDTAYSVSVYFTDLVTALPVVHCSFGFITLSVKVRGL